ncbi:helix-turn-helix transcriptional regulator [Chitinophaga sp. 212800010-3]|uniref:helix-turn-helix transcriptional regulator n=1 Tax=unclassified Chitinophaga TaxID=2619133 RepID=UPI002DF3CEF6|nr:hypothetical protein [Chitinophaga sp. 212800010-3]
MVNSSKPTAHVGLNIRRFRLLWDYSQAGLAHMLEEKSGHPVSQQFISDLEDRPEIADEELLQHIAEILKVTPEVLKHLDLDSAIQVFNNTFTNHDHSHQQFATHIHNQQTYVMPLDKLLEFWEKERAEYKAEIDRLKKALGQ